MRTLIIFFCIAAIFIILVWAFLIEPNFILVRDNVTVVSGKWPKELDGLKIVVAGDFHAGKYFGEKQRVQKAIDAINAENPDLVLFVGDYINNTSFTKSAPKNMMNLDEMGKIFAQLKPKYGTYAIFGNHDLNFNDARDIGKMLSQAGIIPLRNTARIIETPKGSFAVYGAIGTPFTSGGFNRVMKKIPEEIPVLAMTHSPDGAIVLSGRPAVIFAGHTHGGQARIPFCRPFFANCRLGTNYADGLVDMGDSFLYTTRGLGTSRIPARFACPPTISVINMYSPSSGVEGTQALPGIDIN